VTCGASLPYRCGAGDRRPPQPPPCRRARGDDDGGDASSSCLSCVGDDGETKMSIVHRRQQLFATRNGDDWLSGIWFSKSGFQV